MSDRGQVLSYRGLSGNVTPRRVLADEGHAVVVEKRGDAGLALARDTPFELVITDMKLPGLNGLDLVRDLASVVSTAPDHPDDGPRDCLRL